MMAWENGGMYSFIYDQFSADDIMRFPGGDQEYISNALAANHKSPNFFQDTFKGIYSYKRECRHSVPVDARIICFHGRPRPSQVNASWIKENWR
jgi:hypothetical protein